MDRPPIGYRSRKKRKWPRIIIPVFIIMGLIFVIYKIDPDLIKIKNIIGSFNKDVVVEKPLLNKTDENIQVNDTVTSKQNTNEILSSKDEKLENIENSSWNYKNVSTVELKSEKELVNTNSINIPDKKKSTTSDSNEIVEEKTIPESKSINSKTEKFEEKSISVKDSLNLKIDKYYVIISSVDSKEASELQQKKFQDMGIKTEVIYVSKNNRYRISLGTFTSFNDASAKSKIFESKHPSYKTWVWKVQ